MRIVADEVLFAVFVPGRPMLSVRNPVDRKEPQTPAVRAYGRGRQVELALNDKLEMGHVEQELVAYLKNTEGRLKGAETTLNVGRRSIKPDDVSRFRETIEHRFGLKLVGVTSHPDSVSSLLVDRPAPPPEPVRQLELAPVAPPREDEWQQNLLVRGVCRSGMVVHNDGNVVVLGDVNPGAEITATGDIVVFGKLRGLAHAGMKGASNATIIAVSIESARLKIGDLMTVVEAHGGETRWQGGTQMAFVKDGCIVVDPFDPRSMQLEEV